MEKWKGNRVKKLKQKVDTDGKIGHSRNVHSFKECGGASGGADD